MTAALVLRHLTKTFATRRRYGWLGAHLQGREVLRDVNLSVRAGEAVAMIGANGAGKSSLLEIISTVLLPSSGTGAVFGHDVVTDAAAVRRMIGLCSSDHQSFYPRLTAIQNLEFFASLGGLDFTAARARTRELIELLDLDDARDEIVQRYSDGMRQRLLLARALLPQPALLLLDEPTRSLDPDGRVRVQAFIRELVSARGVTVLMATHDLQEAGSVCDRTIELADGILRDRDARTNPLLADTRVS